MLRAADVRCALGKCSEVDSCGRCHYPSSQRMSPLGCSHTLIMPSCTADLYQGSQAQSCPVRQLRACLRTSRTGRDVSGDPRDRARRSRVNAYPW